MSNSWDGWKFPTEWTNRTCSKHVPKHQPDINTSISADPGLGQGRGGAWDHRRCGTSPSSLSTVKPILQPSSHINSFCRLPALKPSKLHLAANSHPAPHINRFFWPLLHPTATPRPHINGFLWASKFAVCQPLQTLTWHASSCSQQPPRATHQWLLVATLAA